MKTADKLKKVTEERDLLLEKMERAVAAVAHFTQRYNEDMVRLNWLIGCMKEGRIGLYHKITTDRWQFQHSDHEGYTATIAEGDSPLDAISKAAGKPQY